jgi:hypothetical protein
VLSATYNTIEIFQCGSVYWSRGGYHGLNGDIPSSKPILSAFVRVQRLRGICQLGLAARTTTWRPTS